MLLLHCLAIEVCDTEMKGRTLLPENYCVRMCRGDMRVKAMNWRVILPTALQYAFVLGSCWFLVSGQMSENTFSWILLLFIVGRLVLRRVRPKAED